MQAEKTQDEVLAQQAAEIAVLRADKAHMARRLEALYAEKAALGHELDLCRAKCDDLTRSLGHVTRANGDLANERHRLAERVAQLEAEVAEVRSSKLVRANEIRIHGGALQVRAPGGEWQDMTAYADICDVERLKSAGEYREAVPTVVTRAMAVEHMRRGGVIKGEWLQRRIRDGKHQICVDRVDAPRWYDDCEESMIDEPGFYTLMPIEAQQDEVTT